MNTLSRCNRLEILWDEIKQNYMIPDEVRIETEQRLFKNKLEVQVNYCDHRIEEDELQNRLAKFNPTIAMAEPLVKDVSIRLDEDVKILITDVNGVIIASQAKEVIGYCCPAADLINSNTKLRSMLDIGCALEVKYNNGIHSQLIPIFDEIGEIQFFLGISDYKPLTIESSNLLYLAAQLFQQRYKYILMTNIYTGVLMNAISDCAVLLDENGRIINANKQCANLFKLDDTDILKGISFSHLIMDHDELDTVLIPNSRQHFNIQFWSKEIPCQVTYKQPINTPYGTQVVLLFNPYFKQEWAANSTYNNVLSTFQTTLDDIIGSSKQIQEIKTQAKQAAGFMATVLIEGESGTGKELLAQAIHEESRQPGRFIAINCGAIPPELIQSELFGYEEGAFTGAKKKGNPGKLEMADGGTVFLDEIGEMPYDMQVSLLRFLQDKTITRIGSHEMKRVDVRIIAATNRNLKEEVEKGNFREDLYYRLNVIYLHVPPLRERVKDIPVLLNFFLEKWSTQHNKTIPRVSDEVIETLINYSWPGNVRELENIIERSVIMSPGNELIINGLPQVTTPEGMKGIQNNKARVEKEGIEYYLSLYHGNVSQTARALGVTRQTLYRKIKNLNICREDYI